MEVTEINKELVDFIQKRCEWIARKRLKKKILIKIAYVQGMVDAIEIVNKAA